MKPKKPVYETNLVPGCLSAKRSKGPLSTLAQAARKNHTCSVVCSLDKILPYLKQTKKKE